MMPMHVSEATDDIHDDIAFSKRGCCSWVPFLRTEPSHRSSSVWQRINTSSDATPAAAKHDPWWSSRWSKVQDWSELVAGPKWKTFIRRFKKRWGGKQAKFHYDPLSYTLNFDEGPGQNSLYDDDDIVARGFSSRYSLPPSAKSSLDFDREGIVLP